MIFASEMPLSLVTCIFLFVLAHPIVAGTTDLSSSTANNATYRYPSLSATITRTSSEPTPLSTSATALLSSNSTTQTTAYHTTTSAEHGTSSTSSESGKSASVGAYILSGIGFSSGSEPDPLSSNTILDTEGAGQTISTTDLSLSPSNTSTTSSSASSDIAINNTRISTVTPRPTYYVSTEEASSGTLGNASFAGSIATIYKSYVSIASKNVSTTEASNISYSGTSSGPYFNSVNFTSQIANGTAGTINSPSLMPTGYTMPLVGFGGSNATGGRNMGTTVSDANRTGPITSTPSSPWTVPAVGNSSSYYSACNAEWMNFSFQNGSVDYTAVPNTTVWATEYSALITTLCDGKARIVGDVTSTGESPILTTLYVPTTHILPTPTCSIGQSACVSMQSEYATGWSTLDARPVCTVTGAGATQDYCGACTVVGGKVELMYFPVTTNSSRDMCATAPATPTICPFGATTPGASATTAGIAPSVCAYYPTNITKATGSGAYIVSDGMTFYENMAYISYQTAYATNSCGRLGATYAGGILPVASSNVYSVSGYNYELYNHAYSFNFADLNSPIPASAYLAMPNCAEAGNLGPLQYPNLLNGQHASALCRDPNYVIYESLFLPVLAVPPDMRNLDPEWSQCLLGLDGLWDPPKALQPASSEAAPTAPTVGNTPTTTASPAQTPDSPAATTPGPTTTPVPAQSDTQGSSTAAQSQGGGSSASPASQDAGSDPSSDNGGSNPSTKTGQGTSTAQSSAGSDPNGASGVSSNAAGGNPTQAASTGGKTSSADPGGVIISVIENQSTAQSQATGGNNNVGGAATTQGSGSNNNGGSGNSGSSNSGSGNGGSSNSGGSDNSGSNDGSDGGSSNGSNGSGGTAVATVNSATFTVAPASNSQGSTAVVVAAGGSSATLTPGQTTSIGGQVVSAQSSGGGAVIGSGGSATTIAAGSSDPGSGNAGGTSVVSVGSSAFTVGATQSAGSTAVVVANGGSTVTLSAGQTTSIGGQVVSAPSSGGAVFGSGNAATTVSPGSSGAGRTNSGGSVVTVGSSAFTVVPTKSAGSSEVIVANGGTTVTLAPGSTTTLGGQVISAPASGGAIIGTGSAATTVQPESGSNAGSGVIATVAGQTISADPSNPSDVIINGQTLTPGQTTIISGTPVYVGSGSVLVGGSNTQPASTYAIPTVGSSSGGAVILGTVTGANGQTLTIEQIPGSSQTLVVDGSSTGTLGSNGVATVAGVTLSAGSNNVGSSFVVVDGSQTVPLNSAATASPQAVITLGGQTFTATEVGGSASEVVIDGTTLHAGGAAATIDGTVVSLGSTGLIVGGTKTVPLSSFKTPGTAQEAVLTLNGQVYTASQLSDGSQGVVIDGTTLHPGGPAATIHGVVVSDGSAGIVVGGSQTVPFSAVPTAPLGYEALLRIGEQIFTAIEPSGENYVLMNGTTLFPGGPAITIDGTIISDGPNGLVIGGTKTIPLTAIPTSSALEALITIAGEIYTAIEPEGASLVIVDGTTLYPGGPAMTLYGTVISDGPDGLVVGTRTVPLSRIPSATPAPTPATGAIITAAASATATGGHKKSAAASSRGQGVGSVVLGSLILTVAFCLL